MAGVLGLIGRKSLSPSLALPTLLNNNNNNNNNNGQRIVLRRHI